MKSQLLKQIRTVFTPKQVKLNKRIFLFLFFLTISTLIWFFNKLEKNYFSQIEINVRYFNFPKNVIQTQELPNKIIVTIYGRGFTIMRYKLLSVTPFYIDLKKYLSAQYNGNETVYLYTDNLISSLDKELSEEVKIIQIEPKAIKFSFAKKQIKKLPVIPNVKYQIANNYLLMGFSIKPNFVIVTGPSEILDTLDTLKTILLRLNELRESHQITIPIQPIKNCEINPANITIELMVDKKTEKIIQIPIDKVYQGKGKINQIIPEAITLKCYVAVSKYKDITIDLFNIEFKEIQTKNPKIINVQPYIRSMPNGVSKVFFEPNYFTVIFN
ncbi:MAG: YbbR-like domain-containing protein [Bacteroidales bacterium]|nr:YbbR-like domain-containing protein [Bacteroidales bacterium]